MHYDADPFLGLQLYTICPHLHSCTHIKGSSEYFECKSLIFIINCKFNSIPLYTQNPVVMCDTFPWLFFVVFHLLYVQFALAYLRFQFCTINNNTFCINCSVVPAVVLGAITVSVVYVVINFIALLHYLMTVVFCVVMQ